MIELRDVSLAYSGEPVLEEVSFDVDEGELLVVAGRTGSGKSTLLGVVAGLVPRFTGGALSGDVLLDGASIVGVPPRERADRIGYVGQDPLAGFVTDTVEEELAFGMEQLGLDPGTMRRRVEETLDLLGIAELRSRDLRTLSGGQQQRVAIGSVLTMHPRLVVLDEPTSALDPTAAEDVLATLTRLVHDLGLSVILAEHRLERVLPFADRVAVVEGGRVRVGEPAATLASAPVAPPIVELGRRLGWSPLPLSVRDARRRARGLALPPPPPAVPTGTGDVLLRGDDLTVTHGAVVALREVSVGLRAGEVTALMGRNGSGKSTLLWALQGGVRRRGGRVRVGAAPRGLDAPLGVDPAGVDPAGLDPAGLDPAGQDPAGLDAKGRHGLIGLVPQTAADLLYLETVADECAAAGPGCRELLERLVPGIDDATHPRDLSEGQRLALALAIVLTPRPRVLLLDEPTRGLDYSAKAALSTILRDLAADGHAVLVASHDVEFVAETAERVVVLADGEVVSSGPAVDVLTQSPAFAPQVTKILGAPWLTVGQLP